VSRKIKIVGIRNEKPDTKLYVLALIALARQLQEQEAQSPEPSTSAEDARSQPEVGDG
jgi:hypothetical protein